MLQLQPTSVKNHANGQLELKKQCKRNKKTEKADNR